MFGIEINAEKSQHETQYKVVTKLYLKFERSQLILRRDHSNITPLTRVTAYSTIIETEYYVTPATVTCITGLFNICSYFVERLHSARI